jgi:membrane protein DedA with SNARE-associated domain
VINRLSPRARYVLWSVFTTIIAYLAGEGLLAMIDGRASAPSPMVAAVLIVIVAYAALARRLPDRFEAKP